MVIVMKKNASERQIERVVEWIESVGYRPHVSAGVERTIIGAVGDGRGKEHLQNIALMGGVEKVMPILKPYKLASREFRGQDTVIPVGPLRIGGGTFTVMAGPCAVESQEQLMECAYVAKKAGADVLRGGAFKPRTSPYSFQGMEEEGLRLLREVGDRTGLPVVTEVVNTSDVDLVERYADILQIGARNAQNFALLKAVGRARKPVLLKRGMMTTVEELLMSAEYILSGGNEEVILCERGIRTFETATRNTLDLSAVVVLKELSHLPVIVDPSHAAGNWRYVRPLARAAVAVGADGIIVEVHPEPEKAVSDGMQSLKPEKFYDLMADIGVMKAAMGKGGRA
ncbi:MAG TPA: 3-deoxy-7-phosphoheptulonate synthase [Syntrophales bacterium]|nr:3-deoxy-7-phosphoheptulonate synthase [Syntrophales bacterium]HOM07590.1 3-deoxy-7-phosphoheptulonate synthase [Syntrophales bacterium]HOO00205.1 3-deoxy-7-phosphoheptulonate synthase [Syntrophales bacterium]HPC01580.1 3-deoxy-7-phosphoheptulonate synthase [Syntrophales bacterium]HPQ07170.1 3-deoxy-7-phosphoheptulonate synthase [Syntrophales bacterium]